jgi:hypothetical protein
MSESAATNSESAATKKRVTISELPPRNASTESVYHAVWRFTKERGFRLCNEDECKQLWYSRKQIAGFRQESKLNNQQDYEVKIDGKTIFIISFAVAGTIYVGIKLMFNGGKKQSYRTYKNRTVKNKTYKNRK